MTYSSTIRSLISTKMSKICTAYCKISINSSSITLLGGGGVIETDPPRGPLKTITGWVEIELLAI